MKALIDPKELYERSKAEIRQKADELLVELHYANGGVLTGGEIRDLLVIGMTQGATIGLGSISRSLDALKEDLT